MNEPIFDHERLDVYRLSIDYLESNTRGKSDLKRIVSMLERLIQRTETVSEGSIEYEYRDAEYEYEEMPKPGVARELPKSRF